MEYAIELKELTKRFNQFTANDKISFSVQKGETDEYDLRSLYADFGRIMD